MNLCTKNWYWTELLYQEMYIIVHGALHQNCWFKNWYVVHGVLHQDCYDLLVHGALWCVQKLVHGAMHQNCADLKSLPNKMCTKVGMWCMVYGALHQNCADLNSTIQDVYQSWCMMHSGACADLKSTIQSVYQSWCMVNCGVYQGWCMVHCTRTVVI